MILENRALDSTINQILDIYIDGILKELDFDTTLISYTGSIEDAYLGKFREFIEMSKTEDKKILTIILNTPGGSATAVEKMVEIIRYHYDEVYFIVPGSAMSAGTIFCMSGDKIFMDYSSSLGPIDPQVFNGERWVPALGYIDKIEELIGKSRDNSLTDAEFAMLHKLDLATIATYEQARDLSIELLKKWLVTYKFKNWDTHQSEGENKGNTVSDAEKVARAEEIAQKLSDNNIWHSHGRYIGINTLRDELRLLIDDYSENTDLKHAILSYHDLLQEFVAKNDRRVFFHAKLN